MAGVNKVILVGNLGRDPEVRNMQNGGKVVNMTLATSQTWKDRQTGERQERVEWHRVVIFNENIANNAERYLRKGSQVYVEGELRTRKWTDQSGMERYTTEVVIDRFRGELTFLSTRTGDDNGAGGSYGDSYGGATPRSSSQSDSSYSGVGQKPQQPTQHYGQQAPQQNQGWDASSGHDDFDDEIPF